MKNPVEFFSFFLVSRARKKSEESVEEGGRGRHKEEVRDEPKEDTDRTSIYI